MDKRMCAESSGLLSINFKNKKTYKVLKMAHVENPALRGRHGDTL
jgi:hypothetical protein